MLACTETPSDSLRGAVAEPLSRAGSPAAVLNAPEVPSSRAGDGKPASAVAFTAPTLPTRGSNLQARLEPQLLPELPEPPPKSQSAGVFPQP